MLTDSQRESLRASAQPVTSHYARYGSLALAWFIAIALTGVARADFETVIHSPGYDFEEYDHIGSNTQVNLYPGGVLPPYYNIGPRWEPGDNIEINLLGGAIGNEANRYGGLSTNGWLPTTNVTFNLVEGDVWGDVYATDGALVNLSDAHVHGGLNLRDGSLAIVTGGVIEESLVAIDGSAVHLSGGEIGNSERGSFYYYSSRAQRGSTFLMTGGTVYGGLQAIDGYLSVSGGRVAGDLELQANSVLDWTGGHAGSLRMLGGSSATLTGGDFRLDGVPIEGLSELAQPVAVPRGSILTGVLSDGTPLAITDAGFFKDRLDGGQLLLRQSALPDAANRMFVAPDEPVPSGLRTGQSLVLDAGGVAPKFFTALQGSTLTIAGGEVGEGFEAVGANVRLTAGRIGELSMLLQGSTLHASGGEIGSNFELGPGSRLELSGGTVDSQFVAHSGSEVDYTGGKFRGSLETRVNSSFTIAGGEFKLNGAPISSLASLGATAQIDLAPFSILSGTLSDGTPFALGSSYQWFAPGTLSLQTVAIPAAGPSVIRVPTDPVPLGLRSGQTLVLSDGGDLGDDFTADFGSVIRMSGGRVGNGLKVVGSLVNITGGEVFGIQALLGSVVNFSGGVTQYVQVERGGVVNLSGGEIAGQMSLSSGGRARVTGGKLGYHTFLYGESSLTISGDAHAQYLHVSEGASLTIEGGVTHNEISVYGDAQLNLRGGRLGDDLIVSEDSHVAMSGYDFRVDGVLLPTNEFGQLLNPALDLPSSSVLSGVFSDGTPFAFSASDRDYLLPGTLRLNSQIVIRPAYPHLEPRALQGLLPGQKFALGAGDVVSENFTAGWGSELTIAGGEVGDNFEAVGAVVNLSAGTIGANADVLFGAELNQTGGSIAEGLEIHRGGVVNLAGGDIDRVTIRSGGLMTVSGGTIGDHAEVSYYTGRIAMERGSELHVFGSNLTFRGDTIEGLEPGDSVVLDTSDEEALMYGNMNFTGTLLDGSPFDFTVGLYPWNEPYDWERGGPFTIRLTSVAAELSVPEPTTLLLSAIAIAITTQSRRRAVRHQLGQRND
jgi:hypothetical protein